MTPTDITERGLEDLIVEHLTGQRAPDGGTVGEGQQPYAAANYILGDPADYDRHNALDTRQLLAFLTSTQPAVVERLNLAAPGPSRDAFLARVRGEVAKRGVVDVLRKGVGHQSVPHVDLFYGTPTTGNDLAVANHDANRFSVTRQLRYSVDATALSLDLVLFLNGLPVATFELKNNLTKQTVDDAVRQYRRDRSPKELLFQSGRCAVHFALDDQRVMFCTELKGDASWFLPFDRGHHDGAGNPPNPDGLKTDYLWRQVLAPASLTDILENYAQAVREKDDDGRPRQRQLFPRYHQLDVVRKLLAAARHDGPGARYLIQHSAGSGKSNSIAWLAHQLVSLKADPASQTPVFDSVVVVTDRVNLDRQIRATIRQVAQVGAVVGGADRSDDLLRYLRDNKKIIVTTVQKFPRVLDEIGNAHRDRKFAILIDEAHSSQGGRAAAQMNMALSETETHAAGGDVDSPEDRINRIMEGRKMLSNASYFAFTATPKCRTLELFGTVVDQGAGVRRPFHVYSMKQAIQEGFILDVLRSYTPYRSYYRLVATVEGDPEFDARRAARKLRLFVESGGVPIRRKAQVMVDHFHDQVIDGRKIGGEARAMVVTDGIARAVAYYHAITAELIGRRSPYRAVVAFSGEHEHAGAMVTEASLNGFPSNAIPDKLRQHPYRFLVVADKFQTGYDEPLLHTMYVDKQLSDIKAVQTLSRLNRAHPKKHDTFVLDFRNDTDVVEAAFSRYYRTTVLSAETDPNRLHDQKALLDAAQVYGPDEVDDLVDLYLAGAPRERLDPILDVGRDRYVADLDEDGQVSFKGEAKAFVRTYGFLASLLPYTNADWERLSIFLNFLIPKLPAPKEEDLSKGILETIDLDSYRLEALAAVAPSPADDIALIDPTPTGAGGFVPETEIERLSNIVRAFNDHFGDIAWTDEDRIRRLITEEIPQKVLADTDYRNARRNNDPQNARIAHQSALSKVILDLLTDDTELFRRYQDDPDFRRKLTDLSFDATYSQPPSSP